jgi:hypothetical protein
MSESSNNIQPNNQENPIRSEFENLGLNESILVDKTDTKDKFDFDIEIKKENGKAKFDFDYNINTFDSFIIEFNAWLNQKKNFNLFYIRKI